jgi:hypothetical protein
MRPISPVIVPAVLALVDVGLAINSTATLTTATSAHVTSLNITIEGISNLEHQF